MSILFCQTLIFKSLITYLIAFYHHPKSEPLMGHSFGEGVGLVFATATAVFVGRLLKIRASYASQIIGAESRTLLASMLASKALVTSSSAVRENSPSRKSGKASKEDDGEAMDSGWSSGTILDLANTHTERVQLAVRLFNETWASVVFLYSGLYWVTEQRVSIINDLITGARLLKAFAWEDVYFDLVRSVRHQETKLNRQKILITAFLIAISVYAARFPPVPAVSLYSINHALHVDEAPNLLCLVFLFYTLSECMYLFPEGILAMVDAWQSILRIEQYLLNDDTISGRELTTQCTEENEKDAAKISGKISEKTAVELVDVEFTWTRRVNTDPSSIFVLHPVTLSVKRNQLFAITGATSSGKSTLAAGMAGAMCLRSGTSLCRGPVVYVSATPWIYSATVRENILFGLPYDQERYWRTIAACQLKYDFDRFSHGDMSSLGERGINLSGGQKARVGLARGLYACLASKASEADGIIIIDDPFSALDAATTSAVFDSAVLGIISNFTRIVITHQVQFLGRCDVVAWMHEGRIQALGSFTDLMSSNKFFEAYIGKKTQVTSNRPDSDEEVPDKERTTLSAEDRTYMEDEERHSHQVPWQLFADYINFNSTWPGVLLLIVGFLLSQIGNVFFNILFAWWTSGKYHLTEVEWPFIVISIMVMQVAFWFGTNNGTQYPMIGDSEKLCNKATRAALKAPMSFLDTNPVGRIINRFTQDVNTTDNVFGFFLWQSVIISFHIFTLLSFIIYYVHLVAAITIPWAVASVCFVLYYRPAPLSIKRLESTLSSEVISQISEIVNGASTIQSFPAAEQKIKEKLYQRIDASNRVHFASFSVHGWIAVFAGSLSSIFYLSVGLLALRLRYSLLPGIATAVLISCLDLQQLTQLLLIGIAEIQRGTNCVERLYHYVRNIGEERADRIPGATSDGWPLNGSIEISDVSLRYRDDLPLALRDFNLSIASGEKIGIVGRTGAGKSTMFAVLLVFLDPCKGSVCIDGVDVTKVGLHDLRESIAIIPQEPTLFLGTVRSNIDPLNKRTSEVLNLALQRAVLSEQGEGGQMKPSHSKFLDQDSPISPGGSNLSSGQRQLLSLARALVGDTKIILIDEATASVDFETDAQIQRMLREEFADRTVIAIAHRISTILHYDRIAVLDAGRVVELGAPSELWDKPGGGVFRELCDMAKIDEVAFEVGGAVG